jgi:hypothetical protein
MTWHFPRHFADSPDGVQLQDLTKLLQAVVPFPSLSRLRFFNRII